MFHSLLDPHAAASLPQPVVAATVGAALGAGVGCDRLKTDCCAGGETTVCFGGGAGAGVEKSDEKSNISPIPELELAAAGVTPGAESKAPNPLEELKPRETWGGCC